MSRRVNVHFEVRDMLIMKETLKQMGINFNEISENVIETSNPRIEINGDTSNMNYDSMDKKAAQNIKQEYMVEFYRDKAIREGNRLEKKVEANGEILLTLS